ncbi:MAG TPA: hypothetical protein CFH81_05570 [Sulfurovum sp. UBA12169]|nr:MAG TPA: hypothetical protein CFH81_05570 [Sulfurovum sp. UBA12169]
MKSAMVEFFGIYAHEIVFLHVFSAIVWIGGMIAIRLAVHPNLQRIEDPEVKLGRILAITGNFFTIAIPFIGLMLVTAVLMAVGLGFRNAAVDQNGQVISETAMHIYNMVHAKEIIWFIMTINFTWMYLKRRKAQKLFNEHNLSQAKTNLELIPKFLLPINIVLGVVALWLGVALRGF